MKKAIQLNWDSDQTWDVVGATFRQKWGLVCVLVWWAVHVDANGGWRGTRTYARAASVTPFRGWNTCGRISHHTSWKFQLSPNISHIHFIFFKIWVHKSTMTWFKDGTLNAYLECFCFLWWTLMMLCWHPRLSCLLDKLLHLLQLSMLSKPTEPWWRIQKRLPLPLTTEQNYSLFSEFFFKIEEIKKLFK